MKKILITALAVMLIANMGMAAYADELKVDIGDDAYYEEFDDELTDDITDVSNIENIDTGKVDIADDTINDEDVDENLENTVDEDVEDIDENIENTVYKDDVDKNTASNTTDNTSKKDEQNGGNRDEQLENKEEKLKAIEELREMKALVKASKIESLTYLKELRQQFRNVDKDDRAEVLAELAEIKTELQDYSIDTFVNGLAIDFEKYDNVMPFIEDGVTLAPIRAVTEALGAEVIWNSETQEIVIKKDDININMTIGNNIAYINDNEVLLDVAPQIRDDRTVVPMRFIAESFNLNVDWDGNSNTIIIE